MKTMLISEFKAKCIGVMKAAAESKETVLITHPGKPLVSVAPIEDAAHKERILGGLAGSMQITGDIIHSDFADDWDRP